MSALAPFPAGPGRTIGRRGGDLAGALAILAAGLFALVLFPSDLSFLTRVTGLALLALSLDLVTGYCGIATLGQAALFGAGAYAAGIGAARFGVTDPIAMVAAGATGGALAGLVCGAVILRATGLAQLVLSIAMVQLFHEAANKASAWTGGSDGLSDIAPGPLLGLFAFDLFGRTAYVFGLVLLVLVVLVLRVVMRSPFGMLCRGIKDDPVRVAAMGAAVRPTLIRLYVLSGAVAGIGGALNAISTEVVGLDSLSFTLSAEALVMVVLGGTGSLYGALLGTGVFMIVEEVVSAANPFHWLTIVGLLLVAMVLFAPEGLAGGVRALASRLSARRRPE